MWLSDTHVQLDTITVDDDVSTGLRFNREPPVVHVEVQREFA
jgi:hypothetical protein